jgi:hypothetical protein
MSLEFLARLHQELTITGSAFYEAILAISERVNRKVQIIRLHWQATALLERIEQLTGEVGQQIVDHVARRFLLRDQSDPRFQTLETALTRATTNVQELKRSLVRIDTQIRELKLEAIHDDLLRLQRDLRIRSAAIERFTVGRGAAAVGQPVRSVPRSPSIHIATVLRGPFLLPPTDDLVFRPDDIVVVIGLRTELEEVAAWFSQRRSSKSATATSA